MPWIAKTSEPTIRDDIESSFESSFESLTERIHI